MAHDAKIVLTMAPAAEAEARAAFERALRYDPTGCLTMDEIMDGAACFAVLHRDRPVLHYALAIEGEHAWLRAGVGAMPGVDLVRAVLPAIEDQARLCGCRTLGLATKRPGLVRKMARQGYHVIGLYGAGVSMQKVIQ